MSLNSLGLQLYWFPSPCGEKVGINVRNSMNHPSWWFAFPSPCGEKVGINGSSSLARSRQYIVSVPLRGKGRDQRFSLSLPKEEGYVFPSPCGEKVGINLPFSSYAKPKGLSVEVSVPLRGKGRDQLRSKLKQVWRILNPDSFRPLAGKR